MNDHVCKECGSVLVNFNGVWIHRDTKTALCASHEVEPNFRNYNIGRDIDDKTAEFEQKLDVLIAEYSCYMETESFPN